MIVGMYVIIPCFVTLSHANYLFVYPNLKVFEQPHQSDSYGAVLSVQDLRQQIVFQV